MATERTILPPNVTPLERAVDLSAPHWDAIAATLPGAGDLPASFLPWTAAELGVSAFAPYFEDERALVAAARLWLRERGTAAAVRRALGWLGYTGVLIDEDGPLLHLDPGRYITAAELLPIAHVVRASIPAHVAFYRVFHLLDGRALVLDQGPPLDVGLLDSDGGAPVAVDPWGEPIVVSQAIDHTREAQPPAYADGLQSATIDITTPAHRRLDDMLLDVWALDGDLHITPASGPQSVRTQYLPATVSGAPQLASAWGHTTEAPARTAAAIEIGATVSGGATVPRIHHLPLTWADQWAARPWLPWFDNDTTQSPEPSP